MGDAPGLPKNFIVSSSGARGENIVRIDRVRVVSWRRIARGWALTRLTENIRAHHLCVGCGSSWEYKLDVSRVPLDGVEAAVDAWLTVIHWLIREFTRRRHSRGYSIVFVNVESASCMLAASSSSVSVSFGTSCPIRFGIEFESRVGSCPLSRKNERKIVIRINNNDLDIAAIKQINEYKRYLYRYTAYTDR